MSAGKGARKAIDAALESVGGAQGGELFHDELGPAIYRLEPSALTIVACEACHYVGLVPSIPRKAELVWTCTSCKRRYGLRPPLRVVLEGNRPVIAPAAGPLH